MCVVYPCSLLPWLTLLCLSILTEILWTLHSTQAHRRCSTKVPEPEHLDRNLTSCCTCHLVTRSLRAHRLAYIPMYCAMHQPCTHMISETHCDIQSDSFRFYCLRTLTEILLPYACCVFMLSALADPCTPLQLDRDAQNFTRHENISKMFDEGARARAS